VHEADELEDDDDRLEDDDDGLGDELALGATVWITVLVVGMT
jgi:hypothetical protein